MIVGIANTSKFDFDPQTAIAIETISISELQQITQGSTLQDIPEETTTTQQGSESAPAPTPKNSQIDAPITAPVIADEISKLIEENQSTPAQEQKPQSEVKVDEVKTPPKIEEEAPKQEQPQKKQHKFAENMPIPRLDPRPRDRKPPKTQTAPEIAQKKSASINKDAQSNKKGSNDLIAEKSTPKRGQDNAQAVTLTATDKDNLIAQMKKCWRPPVFITDTSLEANIFVDLNPDGSLKGRPVIANNRNDPEFATFAGSAVRAIQRCAPYSIREGTYNTWKQGLSLYFNLEDIQF